MNRRRAFLLGSGLAALASAETPATSDELARLWNEFAAVANKWCVAEHQGVFDIKLAMEVSRAFRRIENSGYWPRS